MHKNLKSPVFLVVPVVPQRLTPFKYSMPHVRASLLGASRLVQVLPNNPQDGQSARVDVHDLASMTSEIQNEIEVVKLYPGPLIK